MEVEPRIAKQYKCQYCAVAKITVERGWRVKKSVFASFIGRPEDREFIEKKKHFGASYSTSKKLLLIARHIMTTGPPKMPLKLAV